MAQRKFVIFYKPYWRYLLEDVIALVLSFFVVLEWFPLSTQVPFQKYDVFACVFSFTWLVISYFAHRYIPVKFLRIWTSIGRLVAAGMLQFGVMWLYMYVLSEQHNYSIWVLLTIWLAMFFSTILILVFSHAYRYATFAEPEIERSVERGPQSVLRAPKEQDCEQIEFIRQTITDTTSAQVVKYLEEHLDLYSSNTFTLRSSELYNLQKLKYYRFDTIINFMPLNQIRGVNNMFGVVNDKLPDNGLFVCCFEPQSTTKRNILRRFPPVIDKIYYTLHYLYKRVLPKIFVTQRLYFDITAGKNRIFSKAEVLGRLCYCGFDIVDEHKFGDLVYVIARRAFTPQTVVSQHYGIFVKLNRVGKDGRLFRVYKFRTMHPYSEYLQAYIYKRYSLREGGKFNHDIRISTMGHFMRRCWIDELPMIINLFRGEMKLVGVRPISKHYFSLYSSELQEKRTHHKPGLLPPFYADMPKTLPEIEASEMRYLTRCEEKGTFSTDFIYFWKIFYTIVFKRARSH